jgi:putative glutamine amidotransferase
MPKPAEAKEQIVMKPLIAVLSSPFRTEYAELDREKVPQDTVRSYWLLESLTRKICDSIARAGGIPALLPPVSAEGLDENLPSRFDGFVLAGGEDISSELYGERPAGAKEPDSARDGLESKLLRPLLAGGKPVLAICRGAQLINAVMGGTLHQDLKSLDEALAVHDSPEVMKGYVHSVAITEDGFLGQRAGTLIEVNSMHHQAVKELAPGLRAVAESPDGIAEAFLAEREGFLVAVQWHPECLAEFDPLQARLFEMTVEAARRS